MRQIDPEILQQAAEWMICIRSGQFDAMQQAQFQLWHQRSVQHQLAWKKAEKLLNHLNALPEHSPNILQQSQKHHKQLLPKLLVMALLSSVMIYVWQSQVYVQWHSDYSTKKGELKQFQLPDNSQINLNTNTAIDVDFTDNKRLVRLHYGEIIVKTGHENRAIYRPFIVENQYASMQALGTEFAVRSLKTEQSSCLAVIESAVKVTLKHTMQSKIIQAGEQICFNEQDYQDTKMLDPVQYVWKNQMILAYEMPLKDLIQELGRYQKGYLYVDPDIANLKVSGSFPTNNLSQLRYALQASYPVQIKDFAYERFIYIKKE